MKKTDSKHAIRGIKIRSSARTALDFLKERKNNASKIFNQRIIELALELGWGQNELLEALNNNKNTNLAGDEEETFHSTSFRTTEESREALDYLQKRGFNISGFLSEEIIRLALSQGWKKE